MKKILALAIGFGLVLGTVSFAQDKMDDTTKTEKNKRRRAKRRPTPPPSTDKEEASFSGRPLREPAGWPFFPTPPECSLPQPALAASVVSPLEAIGRREFL